MTDSAMPIYDAMSTLRAVRRLRDDPIPDDVLERVLQAAAWAPSGGNVQPWRAVVVRDAETRQAIGDLYRPQWQRYAQGFEARMANLEGEVRAKQERMLKAANHLGAHMGSAPVLLVFCFNPKLMAITDADLDRPSVVGGGSVYPAIENLMLACVAEGLGCTLTTLLCYEESAMKALLAIPDDWYTCAVVPIGYPQGRGHGPITRRTVAQQCYADQFGASLTL